MNRGLNYDTSEKRFLTKDKIYGDGDLRYIIKKDNKPKSEVNIFAITELSEYL